MNEPEPNTPPDDPDPGETVESESDGLAIGGVDAEPTKISTGTHSDGDEPEPESDDGDEAEDPSDLHATGQQDFPPTPYEECLDLNIFVMRTESIHAACPTIPNDETGTEAKLGLGTSDGEDDNIDGQDVQEQQENDSAATMDEQHHNTAEEEPIACGTSTTFCSSGVRRKTNQKHGCILTASTDVKEHNTNGTKKKVCPNRLSPEAGCSGHERKKLLWLVEEGTKKVHRPLERSWPPRPGGKQRSPEEFSFAIIDMDETEGAVGGEFGERPDGDANLTVDGSIPQRTMHLDANGNDTMKLEGIGSKIPLRKTAKSSGTIEKEAGGASLITSLRPHRQLTRTPTNGREFRVRDQPLPIDYTSTVSIYNPVEHGSDNICTNGSSRQVPDLVCPPTPTHHARRHRVATASVPCPDGLGPQELSSARTSVEEIAVDAASNETGSPENDVTVRRVPSMRLPSIPERSRTALPEPNEPLPPAWEARMDSHGRIFYIDHATRTTSWQRPGAFASSGSMRGHEHHRQQLDRRYQSFRRTIYEHMRPDVDGHASVRASTSISGWPQPDVPVTSGSSRARAMTADARTRETTDTNRTASAASGHHPALMMICRSDFYSMLHTHGEAIQIYNRNAALKHMVSRVRRDPRCFGRYQHNRDLVALVNCFAQTVYDLPTGWETKLDQSGKKFFIDHGNRRTSFMDPRLPTEGPRARHHHRPPSAASLLVAGAYADDRPVPPPRPPGTIGSRLAHVSSPEIPIAYNDKVVAFLRQPNILEILRERHGAATCSRNLRDKINAIRVEGTIALSRYSHDLELTILLSLFEDEVMTYVPPRARTPPEQSSSCAGSAVKASGRHVQRAPAPMRRDFEAKLRSFYRKLESKGYGQGPHKLRLEVRRAHLVDDAFERIMAASRRDLQRCRLNIVWDTEDGLDYGGPSREFFYLLSRQLFSPYRKMFEYSANDIYTVQIAPEHPTDRDDILEWYRFSGRVLGLALVHQYLLDAFFTRPFYKALLRLPVSLSDLESLDSSFHQSLLWIRDNNMDNCGELGLNFTVTEERSDGSSIDIELKPNGRNITVSERNKRDYLERIIKWRLERGVLEQTEWLVRGFNEVVDHRLVSVFDASELELVISGTVEIDVHDWRANTEYRGGYHDSHHVIVWFWAVIDRLSNEQRLRLLQFVTGTSSIPHDGFAGLRGSNGLRRFCIEKWGKSNALPRSHTCFNRLDLPPYPTPDILYEKLVLAVEETNTFGIE